MTYRHACYLVIMGVLLLGPMVSLAGAVPSYTGFVQAQSRDDPNRTIFTVVINGGAAGEFVIFEWENPRGMLVATQGFNLDKSGSFNGMLTFNGLVAQPGDKDRVRLRDGTNSVVDSCNGKWVPGVVVANRVHDPSGIPTLSEWGLILLAVIVLVIGSGAIKVRSA